MKRWMMMLAVVGLLAGCASTPTEQEGAKVEDAKPSVAATDTTVKPKPPKDATTAPVTTQKVGVDPLKDPANILSRRSIYFDYDSNVVKEEFKPVVSAHAKHLSTNRNTRMAIQGNTDERGSREYNVALGQRRAEAVTKVMVLMGARPEQIEAVSWGEERPRGTGHDEKSWSENRRSDFLQK